ncbi:hypothetical protein E5D57_001673 [Metarhizium anisopliae]|nr:hypothetical protein E5D57_001673 [Metarhizium anisopliae]
MTVSDGKTTCRNFNSSTAPKSTHDVALSYGGGPYNRQLFKSICSKLTSSLFYIELDSVPAFYSSPEVCTIIISCRVSASNALLDLIFKLHRTQVYIYYQGDETTPAKALLCTAKQVTECRNMQPFRRQVTISALSLQTAISVQMDGIDGKKQHISNCPYRIEKLVRDQGLLDIFGNSSHTVPSSPRQSGLAEGKADLYVEVDRLIETLQTFKE